MKIDTQGGHSERAIVKIVVVEVQNEMLTSRQ